MNRTSIVIVLLVCIVISVLIVSKSQLVSASQVTAIATFADTWTPIPSRTLPVWTPLPTNTPLPPPSLTPSATLVSLGIRAFNGYQGMFSPNGVFVLTTDRDKTATLWDVRTGNQLRTFRTAEGLTAATISPDGKTIVTSDYSPSVQTWDVQTGSRSGTIPIPIDRSVTVIPANRPYPVSGMEFSPDGTYLLITQGPVGAFQFDFTTGNSMRLLNQGQLIRQDETAFTGAYSPDNRYLAISTNKQTVMVDIAANTIARTFDGANTIQFSSDGRFILTSWVDKDATLWELASSKTVRTYPGKLGRLSPNGLYVLTANADGTATLWDRETATNLYTFKGTRKEINRLDFSPDSRYVLISSNGAVWMLDLWTMLGTATEVAR